MDDDTGKLSVLMGDVIGSEQMERSRLHARFNSAVQAINTEYGSLLLSPLTITLGDEFQGLLPGSAEAFQIANVLR
ncbi:MAG: SatD family protein, partial [Roseibium sp.]|uniref:SatD family protein n=1 Tax=Roseibium sp. TaxID=1936156 RepID=UPI002622410A